MAPLVVSHAEWLLNRKRITGIQMLAAMDSESTDGEGSLLSYGNVETLLSFGHLTSSAQCCFTNSNSSFGESSIASSAASSNQLTTPLNSTPLSASFHNVMSTSAADQQGSSCFVSSDERQDVSSPDDDLTIPFYFETDHVALKDNSDYRLMLRTVALLESQRAKAIHDLDKLIQGRLAALNDPIAFVDKLQKRVDLGIPSRQNVCEVPQIDWEYYTGTGSSAQFKQPRHITRHTKHHNDPVTTKDLSTSSGLGSRSITPVSSLLSPNSKTPASGPTSTNTANVNGDNSNSDTPIVVRGRVNKDAASTKTFNQLWTIDEQRKLEELLIKYPPEEVEMRRWEKIARALGNRTAVQVQSRVQKYFLKLAKSGLPVPGRVPYVPAHMRRKHRSHQHHKHQKFLFPSSTFLASHEPPVYMADDDDDRYSYTGSSADYSDGNMLSQDDISDDEDIPPELRMTDEYQELLRLKRLRRQKQQEYHGLEQHIGYKCDRCECEPIVGVRWHCVDCPTDSSIDFCDSCKNFVFETRSHKSTHILEPVRQSRPSGRSHLDSDYTRFMPGDYNYLDPNYMPAS